MKSFLILFVFLFTAANASADWTCKAYCWDSGEGFILMLEHAGHPVDAINNIALRCTQTYSSKPVDTAYYKPIYSLADSKSVQATPENSCSFTDSSK